MTDNQQNSLMKKRENFAHFIALITGNSGINLTFGNVARSHGNTIQLPNLELLTSKEIDFLYALTLREIGIITKSKRKTKDIKRVKTKDELNFVYMLENARIEKSLRRNFPGATEILDRHWSVEVSDPDFTNLAFGYDISKASKQQAFAARMKLHILGNPKYGWENLFPKEAWEDAEETYNDPLVQAFIKGLKLRSFEHSVDFGKMLSEIWHLLHQTIDNSQELFESDKAKAWEDAVKTMEEEIPEKLQELFDEKEKLLEEIKKQEEEINNLLGDRADEFEETKQEIKQIKKEQKPYKSVIHSVKQAEKAYDEADKYKKKYDETKKKLDDLKNKLETRKAENQEKLDTFLKLHEEKLDKLDERSQNKKERLEKQIENLQNKLNTLNEKLEKAKTEEKSSQIQDKITENSSKLQTKEEELDQSILKTQEATQKLLEKMDERKEYLSKKMEATQTQKEQQEKYEQKIINLAEISENLEYAAQKALENSYKEFSKQDLKIQSSEDMEKIYKNLLESQDKLNELTKKKNEFDQIIQGPEQKILELKDLIKDNIKQQKLKSREELIKVQEKLDDAGFDVEIVPTTKDIEGWDAANEIQKQFDLEASEETGETVVNGSGGGRGNRNILAEIAKKAQDIQEIDPHDIFSDVATLSSFEGFSKKGSTGDINKGPKETTDNTALTSTKAHTIWRKDYDKIIPATERDLKVVSSLKTEYSETLNKMKKLFQSYMKPAYKKYFVGGRDEGDLDSRSIWKLAAKQGEDFYEIQRKKPHNKVCATILVDLSGSCSSWGENAQKYIQATVMMLSESLTACKIEHEIIGYSAPWENDLADQNPPTIFNRKSCSLKTEIIKGFREKNLSGLASIKINQSDNSDGESLNLALDRLKKMPAKKKMIFMISDGKPYMQDADPEILDEDLRKAILRAARENVSLISLGYGHTEHAILGNKHILLQSPEDLPKQIEKEL